MCKGCRHFDTAFAGTSFATNYCRKTMEVVHNESAKHKCFEGGRATYPERLAAALSYAKKHARSRGAGTDGKA